MGRMATLMVMGFNVIFMSIGYNISQMSTTAYNNYIDYYTRTMSRNVAASAANMAGNAFFANPGWRAGYSTTQFGGGSYTAVIDTAGLGGANRVRIRAEGTYNGVTTPVVILLEPSYYCNFGYYVDWIDPNGYFATGDTMDGPFHTQSRLNVIGRPVFKGKVTAKNGLHKFNPATNPTFMGGFQSGVNIALPSSMAPFVSACKTGTPPGKVFGTVTGGKDLWMTFNADGTVTYERLPGGTGPTTVPLTTLAPNGTILCESTNVHIQGTLSGRVTIACSSYGVAGKGQVFIEDDIRYASGEPPAAGISDMLGIVSEKNMIVTDAAASPGNRDLTICGTFMSLTGGLYVDHYNTRGNCGSMFIKGSLVEKAAQWTGTVDGGGHITNGFNMRFSFDRRFTVTPPPFFPTTGSYKVISWYE